MGRLPVSRMATTAVGAHTVYRRVASRVPGRSDRRRCGSAFRADRTGANALPGRVVPRVGRPVPVRHAWSREGRTVSNSAPPEAPSPRGGLWSGVRRSWVAWRRLAEFFRPSRWKLVLLAPLSVIAGIAEASLLALVASVALALSQGDSRVDVDLGLFTLDAEFSTLFAVGIGLAVVRGALHLWLAYLPAAISARAMADLRRRLFDAFVGATWSVKSAERDGQFQSLMTVQIAATAGAIISLGTAITSTLMFATLLFSALALSLPAAIILTISSVALLGALRPLSRRLRRHAKALSSENIEYAKSVQEVALMAEETQVFGASPAYRETFYRQIEGVRAPLLRTRYLGGAIPSLYQSIAQLMLVLALVAVSFMGVGRIATLGAVVLMLIRAQSYGQRVQQAVTSVDEKVPFMNHLADAIDTYTSNAQDSGTDPMPPVERIGMRDVRFSYVPGTEVLRGLSFEVGKGEAIGIVGPSGAGKSTIVQILLRLRDPSDGYLSVNGSDAGMIRRQDWQRRVAYVPQSPQLIWGTAAENIRFFRPEIPDEDVQAAARRAQIHDDIMSWPDGYDTVVGQRASAVSGGQRQRLCIARALVADPQILILDEPTSALDVRSEELVQESLRQLKGTVTLFLVAHRLSTLAICSRVMVIVDGRLQAIDTHSRLLEVNDFYRDVSAITRRQGSS